MVGVLVVTASLPILCGLGVFVGRVPLAALSVSVAGV